MDYFNLGREIEHYEEIPEEIVLEMELEENTAAFEMHLELTGWYKREPKEVTA